jgi:alkylation response protein AidB-like acyl-CoA dehydrogenase
MDFAETSEQTLLRESVRKIASGFGHAYCVEKARSGKKPTELWNALAKAGFLGVSLPEEHGGGGLGITELSLVCEELGAAGCSLFLLVVSPGICGSIIARHGTDAQKKRWLPDIASGRFKMAFAITEPDAG